jgi:hypothetical protein
MQADVCRINRGRERVKNLMIAGAAALTLACSATTDPTAELRANIGKAACNQVNGVYRGRIVDVTLYSGADQSPVLVYVVERDGRRQNAPVGNTTVADRCPDGQPNPNLTPPASGGSATAAEVDPNLRAVATYFSGRLRAHQGTLNALTMSSRGLKALWTSQRCDMIEGEVIDLLLSINRGHPGLFNQGIEAERSCGGTVRRFSAAPGRFEKYRTGKINDPEILRGLK